MNGNGYSLTSPELTRSVFKTVFYMPAQTLAPNSFDQGKDAFVAVDSVAAPASDNCYSSCCSVINNADFVKYRHFDCIGGLY